MKKYTWSGKTAFSQALVHTDFSFSDLWHVMSALQKASFILTDQMESGMDLIQNHIKSVCSENSIIQLQNADKFQTTYKRNVWLAVLRLFFFIYFLFFRLY